MRTLATHYEVLGVDADASHKTIRRAFGQLSLRWHPDRHMQAPQKQRELAAVRIAEINEAWRVLRNPLTRAEYDAGLGNRMPASRPGPKTVRVPATPRRSPETRSRSASRWVWALGILGGVIVTLAVLAELSPGSQDLDSGTDGAFALGSCVRVLAPDHLAEVSCEAEHDAVVVRTGKERRPCPRHTISYMDLDQQRRSGEAQQLCLQRVRE